MVMKVVRSHPRFVSRCPVVIERGDTGLLEDGFCLDVSEGGLRVLGPTSLDVDDEVSLRLHVEGHEIVIRARVRWTMSVEDGARVWAGLQLLPNQPEARASFQGIVSDASRETTWATA